jgi:glycosyltransferase involved in cell wall biosynthesis
VTIVENGSTDGTWTVAQRLSAELTGVDAVRVSAAGRGGALRVAWSRAAADVVAYMDADLSTDPRLLEALLDPLFHGRAEVAIGSRLCPGAEVHRGWKREALSRGYNVVTRRLLKLDATDAQCGFKALRTDAAAVLLAAVSDDEWFFDTELLYRAQHAGFRIHEIPVRWVDDPASTVKLLSATAKALRGVLRVRTTGPAGTPLASAGAQ